MCQWPVSIGEFVSLVLLDVQLFAALSWQASFMWFVRCLTAALCSKLMQLLFSCPAKHCCDELIWEKYQFTEPRPLRPQTTTRVSSALLPVASLPVPADALSFGACV